MMEAHPTDYNGIRFRSKCEAIFYRNLELGGWLVEYEPKQWLADGWGFDFLAARMNQFNEIFNLLIEYKPGQPTEAYLERHLLRIRSLGQKLTGFSNVIAEGSAFRPARFRTLWYNYAGAQWENVEHSVGLFCYMEEASRYRFDLL